jgi:hypothetical protein
MTSPKRAILAAILGVLLGLLLVATPAVAEPGSGTLTWASPLAR